MRSIACLAALCVLAVPATAAEADAALLIPADKIYTAPDTQPLPNGSVLVVGGRIRTVADERTRMRVPAGTRTSDCRGFLVAGFQNSHVHFMGSGYADAARKPAAELERAVESMLTRYGFTTVIDTGSDQENTVAARARIEKGELKGPRILTAGIPLYPPDGLPFYIRDLPPELLAKLHQPKTVDEALVQVRKNLAAGADGTKLFLHTTPRMGESSMMAPDIARALADETHRQGKLVFAHPTSLEGIRRAIDAGVDVVVHTTLGEEQAWDAATLERMVAKRMSVIPTFKLWKYELQKNHAPAQIVEMLVGRTLQELRDFRAAGGQVLFGTDVGYMHEFDPTDEYVYMSQAGMSAMDILASLTTAPAERLKESAQRGRIVAGADADLVVLAADPAADVKNFAQVRCVFRAGKLLYASGQ
jgi:imidazolonepropionase-like amidohydrolase